MIKEFIKRNKKLVIIVGKKFCLICGGNKKLTLLLKSSIIYKKLKIENILYN